MKHAFKEWAVICRALAAGDQSIILRKGGIDENDDSFRVEHTRFRIARHPSHHVIERTGLPRTNAEAAVDTVFEGMKEALAAGERIELRGFGVFSVRARKTGIGRNPRTGTEVSITPDAASSRTASTLTART